ncbi:MAG: flavodoxin-dependent (E)-4-hydroxy-3-methylbut-2-enyl-diphosphate synthase, partial [Desulfatibacillaceae bacterium]|nr:flavodoxin-dependent (E)-4-hydroxy-3-methylbut-2-enyl-diphosphate synthase [Desulfatibacillaceae bacterium]
QTRAIHVGSVQVGGGAPVVVQSMTNTHTTDVAATVAQIDRLEKAGCKIVRLAVPDDKAAEAISPIRQAINLPLIADIHFDHRLAIKAAKNGADGLRINPGNIGGAKNTAKVVEAAAKYGLCLRIGVNAGSLEKDLLAKYDGPTADAMVESAINHIRAVEALGFTNFKISIKASDVLKTIEAYTRLSSATDFPLHVGVTEAGFGLCGTAKSAVGIGVLLFKGIGDTIRVSLSGDPVDEIRVAYQILRSLGLGARGPEIISCPTCGRTQIEVVKIAKEVEAALGHLESPITIAVMGCVVNGPGEAKEADIGIAGGKSHGILFKKGDRIAKVEHSRLVEALVSEVKKMSLS